MSRTILADVDGFTPVIDRIAEELGLVSAAVFGRMWRFCQMEDGICKASLETISNGLGIDRATVMRHAEKLCVAGYIKDTTPDARNVPHVYADTGKAGISINIGVAERNSSVAERNSSVAERNKTVAESQLKKVDTKKDSKRDGDGERRTDATKRGDLVDLTIDLSRSPGMKRIIREQAILSFLATTLTLNTETKRWKEFAKFVDDRQQEHGERVETFTEWLLHQKSFDITFWSPARMKEMWPQAFRCNGNGHKQPELTPEEAAKQVADNAVALAPFMQKKPKVEVA